MDNQTMNKTLLALLLALSDLETPLTKQEQDSFRNIANNLELYPEDWESDIAPSLLELIQNNPNLNQRYQTAKSKLDQVGDTIPSDLIPTLAELEQDVPTTNQPKERGFLPVDDYDDISSGIINATMKVVQSDNYVETVKELSFIEKIKQSLM
jgi:hypothetical protein